MKSTASCTNNLPDLLPGDILLYDDHSFIDWCIKFRTWSDVAHVEVYMGNRQSAASRNGIGVNIYPLRLDGLVYVRRPIVPFNLPAAKKFASKMNGTPYGWLDLLRFYLLDVDTKGIICSSYADLLLNAGDVSCFADDYCAGVVSPRDFQITPIATTVWKKK